MMRTGFLLIAVPDAGCIVERLDLRVLMSRAMKIEERMKKGVNLEDEQRRYHILCDRMEYLGNLISITKEVESVDLGEEYLDLLLLIRNKFPEEAKTARLMANFSPTDKIEKQIGLFEQLAKRAGVGDRKEINNRINFYRQAATNKWHVLEIQEFRAGDEDSESAAVEGLKEKFLSIPVRDSVTSTSEGAFVTLRNQINSVIADLNKGVQAAVNFSDVPHNVISETLHTYAYGKGKPMYLPVIWDDGSKARPIAIHCLKERSGPDRSLLANLPVLKVGEMSGRHQEMDEGIMIFFFRNQEISLGRPSADSDEAAYQKAKEIFKKMRSEGIYRIAFYQTGFQPAAVGFYRALTEEIMARGKASPTLEVIPYYFFGHYEKGKIWI